MYDLFFLTKHHMFKSFIYLKGFVEKIEIDFFLSFFSFYLNWLPPSLPKKIYRQKKKKEKKLYWCYYLHQSKDSGSHVCGIFKN